MHKLHKFISNFFENTAVNVMKMDNDRRQRSGVTQYKLSSVVRFELLRDLWH